MDSVTTFLQERKAIIESILPTYIERLQSPKNLKDSMLYSINAGGKRLRPVLLLAILNAYSKEEKTGYFVACAIEMIHTYSLIHDDLPSMDNDDLRRGKPTNHKVFGEAMAVLAGDGLLTESFRIIAEQEEISPEKRLRLISELTKAAGVEGMVGGQVADIEGEKKALTLEELEFIHENKTAKLLGFSIIAGAILAGASEEDIEKWRVFSYHIGIAFQIRDDILDIEGKEEVIGKPVGSDTGNEKTTYPTLLTMNGAKQKLEEHITTAKEILHTLTINTKILKSLCDMIASRDH
ncbi:polyprenyl synthetase family protein [Bacillus sp. FJAT-47783]|uniref:polyprenyl synthetase family protein n=1 Tax=Bacillus sp. FJAT-47783 TaxID=2922712 RepID=UPI001FADABCE|nr:farnesyl diphosphate synthase [Bacillus sp. FJAT-47783]